MILGIVGLDSQRDSNVTGGGVSAAALERNAIAAIVNVACVIATVQSGLLTRIAPTESVSLCEGMKS